MKTPKTIEQHGNIFLENQILWLNEVIDDLVSAGESVLVTLACEHKDHSEIRKLAAALKKARKRNN